MPVPIVLCGRRERVGSLVIKELEPEYEGMLHFQKLYNSSTGIVFLVSHRIISDTFRHER